MNCTRLRSINCINDNICIDVNKRIRCPNRRISFFYFLLLLGFFNRGFTRLTPLLFAMDSLSSAFCISPSSNLLFSSTSCTFITPIYCSFIVPSLWNDKRHEGVQAFFLLLACLSFVDFYLTIYCFRCA